MPAPQLLVSVRSAIEAYAALAGGADLIDVKEPNRGSLGRADAETINAVVQAVAGRKPVSAAMGELREWSDNDLPFDRLFDAPLLDGVRFCKWGLAGCCNDHSWQERLMHLHRQSEQAQLAKVVAVAYADADAAEAPPVADVVRFACRASSKVMLIDTFHKRPGRSLEEELTESELLHIINDCHSANVQVALAGSLSRDSIGRLKHLQPDWFAVRGAVCTHDRRSSISAAKVETLRTEINASHPKTPNLAAF